MPRSRTSPRWEREAPLTPENAATMHRTVRRVYAVAVALFWLVGAAVAVVMRTAVVIAAVVIFALLDAGAIWFAFRDARAGIRRNTVPQALDGHNVGL